MVTLIKHNMESKNADLSFGDHFFRCVGHLIRLFSRAVICTAFGSVELPGMGP